MRSRLPPVCELAPAPAILVWQDADKPAWELNPAAREWAPTRLWQTAEWLALSRCVLEQARAGKAAGADIERGVRWRAVDVDGAWLAWLTGVPSGDALRDSAPGRHGALAPGPQAHDPQLLQLGLVVGLVGIVLYRIDMVRRRIQLNEWGYRFLGREPQPDGLPLDDIRALTHPDDWHRIKHASEQAMAGTAMIDTEARYLSFDGTYRTLLTRRIAERDEHGNAVGLIGVSMDVTEHKIAEEMQRQKSIAEDASRSKSEFLSRMSHELRTPLNAVLGFAQLMLDDPTQTLAPEQRRRTEYIHDAGRHLLALIDDVLDLTSFEASTLTMTPVSIEPLVRETLQWVAVAAQQANIVIATGSLDGAVMADARRLRQVLANLLSNAVKYNRVGGHVDVSTIDADVHREHWLGIRVRDTGRGLTSQQMQRLFEPFNRLGAEREGIEGTGIGLTIVRSLVEGMQGRIDVQSHPGEGTEFRVWLPRAEEAAPTLQDDTTVPAALDERTSIDVLYIEDNPVNVLLMRELVTMRPNVRLHVAVDGRSGIASACALKPRAVLIDLQLPDIDGFEVLRLLRSDASLREVTMIALSASAMPEDIARARALGFDDYWTKPIDFRQILAGLDQLALSADAA